MRGEKKKSLKQTKPYTALWWCQTPKRVMTGSISVTKWELSSFPSIGFSWEKSQRREKNLSRSALEKWDNLLPNVELQLETQSLAKKQHFFFPSCILQGLFFLHAPFCCPGGSSCLGKVRLCLVNKPHWGSQAVWTLGFSYIPLLPWHPLYVWADVFH